MKEPIDKIKASPANITQQKNEISRMNNKIGTI